MNSTTIIGICGSVFTGFSMLPQLIKLIKEKQADDLSLGMVLTLLAGLCLWIWYGIKQDDLIIIISNSFSLLINIAILYLSLRFKRQVNKPV